MLPITRHGLPQILVGTIFLVALGALLAWLWWPSALVAVALLVWLFAFFRDPDRAVPGEPGVMVSPADGTISDITPVQNDPLLGEPALRIGIFLNVFNCHINRSPCDGTVREVVYKKGRFINALNHLKASAENESNTILLTAPDGRPVAAVKQIAALIARRIVCTAKPGDMLSRGQRIGMIKFGSRTELLIPMRLQPTATVRVGQKVRGAADVVAKLGANSGAGGVTAGPH
jgi:phosphatidylserine decarboxylase